jgi:hypothetical protein
MMRPTTQIKRSASSSKNTGGDSFKPSKRERTLAEALERKLCRAPEPLLYDDELIKVTGETFQKNIDLLAIHLRDARQLYAQMTGMSGSLSTVFNEGVILLASAALEAHLSYWRIIGLAWNQKVKKPLGVLEIEFLTGQERFISEDGSIRIRSKKTPLNSTLEQLPALLARILDKAVVFKWSGPAKTKLLRMVARRDALLHPRWDRYITNVSRKEAGEAIDAVESYLAAVSLSIHPYLAGYFPLVYTTPPGWHKHDGVTYGYRTEGKRPSALKFSTIPEVGVIAVLANEWTKTNFLVQIALENAPEGDSDGSLLTRLAVVRIVAMINAMLSTIAQMEIAKGTPFEDVELLYLSEYTIEMDKSGELDLAEDRQKFKQRITAIPAILARRAAGREIRVDLGDVYGADLLKAQQVREHILHSPTGKPILRVGKKELRGFVAALHNYFSQLAELAPEVFAPLGALVESARNKKTKRDVMPAM